MFPLTLARMGYKVAMSESLKYYSSSFTPLFDYLSKQGVRIIDWDPFEPGAPLEASFDCVTVMAVLEHYPHSLRTFLDNALAIMAREGSLYLEVPNIAYWPKRKALMLGKSPLVPISDIFHSATPFIGHHHEFTVSELRDLLSLAGLKLLDTRHYNYSFRGGSLLRRLLSEPSLTIASLFPHMRECISVLAAK
ncbi:MAG: methyltransferase domain-containing protein [Candidimonas sp.]|nr:methyltransferase domain-containing protein [Candidimonas sp.]